MISSFTSINIVACSNISSAALDPLQKYDLGFHMKLAITGHFPPLCPDKGLAHLRGFQTYGSPNGDELIEEILKLKFKKGDDQPELLLHKEFDVEDDNGKFLAGFREEFTKPSSKR